MTKPCTSCSTETSIVTHRRLRNKATGEWNHLGGRSDKRYMRKDSLWLTAGGRVVKPGHGEYASETSNDIRLLAPEELEAGIPFMEFRARLRTAIRCWRAKQRRIHRR